MTAKKKTSSKGYRQVYDGEWISVPKRGFKEQCCSCGLVHKTDFRVVDGVVQFRCVVDNRATAAVRRIFKFSKEEES
jgi:hypothetical protein